MGDFIRPIIGTAGALYREQIISPNYVAGSTGWAIKRDGSAEFSNVTVRGPIVATSFATDVPNNARVTIDSAALGQIKIYPGVATFYTVRLRGFNNGGTQYVGAMEAENVHPTQGRPRVTLWTDSTGANVTNAQIDIENQGYLSITGNGTAVMNATGGVTGGNLTCLDSRAFIASGGRGIDAFMNMTPNHLAFSSGSNSSDSLFVCESSVVFISNTQFGGASDSIIALDADNTIRIIEGVVGSKLTMAGVTGNTVLQSFGTLAISSSGTSSFASGGTLTLSSVGQLSVTATGSFVQLNSDVVVNSGQTIRMASGSHIATTTGSLKLGDFSGAGYLPIADMTVQQTDLNYSNFANVFMRWQTDGNVVIWQSGVAVWASGTVISDSRVKRDVRDQPKGEALAYVRQLRPVRYAFDRAKLPTAPEGDRFGLIAQEAAAVCPQLVTAIPNNDGTDTSYLLDPLSVALLALAAVRELAERV